MRLSHVGIAFLLFTIIYGCKPKGKTGFKDIFNRSTDTIKTDSTKQIQTPVERPSNHDLLIGKWRVTDVAPATESEKKDALNVILEFTPAGNLFVTDKGKTELAATITFSFDNNYLYSRGTHGELDTLFIQELNSRRLTLSSTKDNKTMVAERAN